MMAHCLIEILFKLYVCYVEAVQQDLQFGVVKNV